jgi:uncharacterized protein
MVKIEKVLVLVVGFLLIQILAGNMALAAGERVYDHAGLFSEAEKAEIEQQAEQLSKEFAIDIVIVTIQNNDGKTSKQYAEDFYVQNGRGYDGTSDGILYLLNMQDREIYIYTRDKAFDYIPDYQVEEILDEVYPYLGQGNYRESVNVFLTEVEDRMMQEGPAQGGETSYTDYPDADTSTGSSLAKELLIYFLISIAVGGLSIGIMAMYNRGRSTVNEGTYLENGSFTVTRSLDQHYDTRVTQTKIQTNSGGGSSFGGGGSGGRSGGGGRSF